MPKIFILLSLSLILSACTTSPEIKKTANPEPKQSKEKNYDIYTIEAGDSLAKISKKFYGTSNKWNIIMDANNLQTANIRIGQKLKIPHLKIEVK